MFPVHVVAAPHDAAGQTAFFQCLGLPAAWVEALYLSELDARLIRSVGQWRLDYPLARDLGADPSLRPAIAVTEAILTRGTFPFCSPALESALVPLSSQASTAEVETAVRRIALIPTSPFAPRSFESHEERLLVGWVTGLIARDELGWTLLPQIALASLSALLDPNADERGDLLLVHPERASLLVELDGAQHVEHQARDEERDRALRAAGVRTVRVPAREMRLGEGPALDTLRSLLLAGRSQVPEESDLSFAIRWAKLLHQIQVAALVALKTGWLVPNGPWTVGLAIPERCRRDNQAAARLATLALSELRDLVARVARLHGCDVAAAGVTIVLLDPGQELEEIDMFIGPADGSAENISLPPGLPRFLVSDSAFPGTIQAPITATDPSYPNAPQRDDARWFLRYLFRKDDFREGQWETVERTLRGDDSVVLLPTGAGKSIAFQLAAFLLPGRCLVVDPIVSLIDDQVDNLGRYGIDRAIGITSQLAASELKLALKAFQAGHYLLCYVAPERFQMQGFRDGLRALTAYTPISVVVIDEAHCVSEWGHDFRTAYLNLGRIAREYSTTGPSTPPLVALTGTASKIVLRDVQRELGITSFDAIITPTTFDRPELHYTVLTSPSDEKGQRVQGFMGRLPTEFGVDPSRFFQPIGAPSHAGLVFCPHVNGEFGVTEQAQSLATALGTRVHVYSGEPPRGVGAATWQEEKQRTTRAFKRNKITLLACTKAFGMGIDKPNVRYTVHTGLPASIEAFYQEAGRAGRDGRRAECAIVLSNDDPARSQRLLGPGTSLEEVRQTVENTSWHNSDDVIRALYFHVHAFRGEQAEVQDIGRMIDALGDLRGRRIATVSWREEPGRSTRPGRNDSEQGAEKSLHRLVLIGVVQDYTIDYAAQEFTVRVAGASQEEIAGALEHFTGAYQRRLGEQMRTEALGLRQADHRQFILGVATRMVAFIYQHVELARRRALAEMLQAAGNARNGEELRRRILDYLQQTEWDERLEAVRLSADGGMEEMASVLDEVATPSDARLLRAAAGRLLAAYPDVPGLLLLRATAEILSPDADVASLRQDVHAAMGYARENYRLVPELVAAGLAAAVDCAASKVGAAEVLLDAVLSSRHTDRLLVLAVLGRIPAGQASRAVGWLLGDLADHTATLIERVAT